MSELINFDYLSAGAHFEDSTGRQFVKLNGQDIFTFRIRSHYTGEDSRVNAIDYNGIGVHLNHEEKCRVITPGLQLTENKLTYQEENDLLWKLVRLTGEHGKCNCDEAPFSKDNVCPICYIRKFMSTEDIKTVDTTGDSDKVEESKLKNKHIETTDKQMNTFNTLKEAVIAAILEQTAANGAVLSLHQITVFIRERTNTGEWEVLDCVARPNNQNIKFWINHDEVRRIVNDMYANQELDALGFTDRSYNGTYMEYSFGCAPTQPASSTATATTTANAVQSTTVLPPVVTQTSGVAVTADVVSKVDSYIKNQKSIQNTPTIKQVQSAVKVKGITCEDFYKVVMNLGYNVVAGSDFNNHSTHRIA
jgi:hypothetical protein